jgi:hypothetical protein
VADSTDGTNAQRARESDEETTEKAALTQVAVVRQHKAMIGDGLDLAVRMLSELKATTSHVGELEGMLADEKTKRAGMLKAISVPTRITALRDFATACRTLAAIMHDVARFYRCVERTSVSNPTGWIGVMPLAVQRVWG